MNKSMNDYEKAIEALKPYLPDWVHYVAMDADLSVWMYVTEPKKLTIGWDYDSYETENLSSILNIPPAPDWKQSLIKVK